MKPQEMYVNQIDWQSATTTPRETVNNLLRKEADHIEAVTKPSFFTSV
jgi:hypothetical protein